MRPGRSDDLPALLELWRAEVRAGRRDSVPGDIHLSRMLAGFDWEAKSRILESSSGALQGAILLSSRPTPLGTVTQIDASVADGAEPDQQLDLMRWGVGLSRAAGAIAVQVWCARGHGDGPDQLGMERVRPWWRMDRNLESELPELAAVTGYELRDGNLVASGVWSLVHNRAFAEHWRFSPRSEDELMAGRPPSLSLLAVTPAGSPASVTLCQIETYTADPRPQPVGIVGSVGTLPEHRRRGLANWLVAEALRRLRHGGARHASLYVDGWNQTRAFDGYRKLGFELAFEAEVWEATFR
ncbi:MAG TPA: GNAT family N-acetyltransferase [Candidatus Dormibacteraeota bacterium]|nr:GNAT family N-acetyltransferase [Candidatus Dormibacteraeota bacterium]